METTKQEILNMFRVRASKIHAGLVVTEYREFATLADAIKSARKIREGKSSASIVDIDTRHEGYAWRFNWSFTARWIRINKKWKAVFNAAKKAA